MPCSPGGGWKGGSLNQQLLPDPRREQREGRAGGGRGWGAAGAELWRPGWGGGNNRLRAGEPAGLDNKSGCRQHCTRTQCPPRCLPLPPPGTPPPPTPTPPPGSPPRRPRAPRPAPPLAPLARRRVGAPRAPPGSLPAWRRRRWAGRRAGPTWLALWNCFFSPATDIAAARERPVPLGSRRRPGPAAVTSRTRARAEARAEPAPPIGRAGRYANEAAHRPPHCCVETRGRGGGGRGVRGWRGGRGGNCFCSRAAPPPSSLRALSAAVCLREGDPREVLGPGRGTVAGGRLRAAARRFGRHLPRVSRSFGLRLPVNCARAGACEVLGRGLRAPRSPDPAAVPPGDTESTAQCPQGEARALRGPSGRSCPESSQNPSTAPGS